MALLKTLRDGIKTALSSVSTLTVYDTVPDSIVVPCVIIQPETINYQVVQGGNIKADWTFSLTLLVQAVDEANAQDDVDDYLSPNGSSSIPAALVADQDLSGAADFAVIVDMSRYGTFTFNDVRYIGAQLSVEATA